MACGVSMSQHQHSMNTIPVLSSGHLLPHAVSGLDSAMGVQSPRSQQQLMPSISLTSKGSALSDLNTSVGNVSVNRQQLGFERRVAWLEEDVSVLHRRLQEECGEGSISGARGDQGLRALVARLDGELAAERRSREALEVRLLSIENAVKEERADREKELHSFSNELEVTLRDLIGRIDDGLSDGASKVRERTNVTEARLQKLISRVDEGLSAGVASLQNTLDCTDVGIETTMAGRLRNPGRGNSPTRQSSPATVGIHCNGRGSLSQSGTPSATPSLAHPETLQVPGSGLSMSGGTGQTSSAIGSPMSVGITGFRPASVSMSVCARPALGHILVYQGHHLN